MKSTLHQQNLNNIKGSKQVLSKMISIVLSIILVFVVCLMIISVYTFIQTKLLHRTSNKFLGILAFIEQTESMRPTIDIDDLVFVSMNNSDLKESDIITYYDNEHVITHRLLKINNNEYTTLGDNSESGLTIINQEQIIGKVIGICHTGLWKKTFASPEVYIPMLLTLLSASFTVLEFKKENNQRRKDGEEKG